MSQEYPTQRYFQTEILRDLRLKAGITNTAATRFFGHTDRMSVTEWEDGTRRPRARLRGDFEVYLLDKLGLRHNHEKFLQIWNDVMVEQWGWEPLSTDELDRYHIKVTTQPPTQIIIYVVGWETVQNLFAWENRDV